MIRRLFSNASAVTKRRCMDKSLMQLLTWLSLIWIENGMKKV
jgi:hypothetical protein